MCYQRHDRIPIATYRSVGWGIPMGHTPLSFIKFDVLYTITLITAILFRDLLAVTNFYSSALSQPAVKSFMEILSLM